MALPELQFAERNKSNRWLCPGFFNLCPDQRLVAACLFWGIYLVRHHRPAQYRPGGSWRRRLQALSLTRWNDYISWTRITDSLLFTGFSVPLLDYLVKTVILDRIFGITAGSQPVLLYTFMALANGLYLSSHNLFRGLPKGAVYGNFFRSILSIPLAMGFNFVIGSILAAAGIAEVGLVLQKWAAIISKAASDVVAAVIEGLADRHKNIHDRLRDYSVKFAQLFDIYAQLELLYPEVQTFKILDYNGHSKNRANAEARDMEKIIMIHSLDLLYFWMYQPRSRMALRYFIGTLAEDERQIFVSSQFTLQRTREISLLFIDGILGDNFPRPLSFYLSRYEGYLDEVKRLTFDVQPSASTDFAKTMSLKDSYIPTLVKIPAKFLIDRILTHIMATDQQGCHFLCNLIRRIQTSKSTVRPSYCFTKDLVFSINERLEEIMINSILV